MRYMVVKQKLDFFFIMIIVLFVEVKNFVTLLKVQKKMEF